MALTNSLRRKDAVEAGAGIHGRTCLRSSGLDLTGTGERSVNLTHVG